MHCQVPCLAPEEDLAVAQVYFVCVDGGLFALCPVAPFQATISLAAVEHLLQASIEQSDSATQSTTQAWLDQVLATVNPLACKSVFLQIQRLQHRMLATSPACKATCCVNSAICT